MKAKVIFLIDKEEEGGRQVFAFFPNELSNLDFKMCYAHIGQHSSCSDEYAQECEPATEEQYNDLKEELISIGYDLEIVDKSHLEA